MSGKDEWEGVGRLCEDEGSYYHPKEVQGVHRESTLPGQNCQNYQDPTLVEKVECSTEVV